MYLLKNIVLNAVMRDETGKPRVFHNKEDAAWLIRSYEQSMRDYKLIPIPEAMNAKLQSVQP